MKLSVSLTLAVAFITSSLATAQASTNTLRVRAWIDGTGHLVINSNSVFWTHLAYAQPGRTGPDNFPTYLDGFPWVPSWPGHTTQQTDCSPLPVMADLRTNVVALDIIAGRENVRIVQQPANGLSLSLNLMTPSTLGPIGMRLNLPE